jgi:hypothetical protein
LQVLYPYLSQYLLLTPFRAKYEELVLFPVYIGDGIGGAYDWNITSVPQTQLDGSTRSLPMGRVVGGGSILNGMAWNVCLYALGTVKHSHSHADSP